MSYCPEYSYWLHAEPKDPLATNGPTVSEVLDAAAESPLARPEGPLVFSIVDGRVSGEVEPSRGTVPRDDDLAEHVIALSAQFPGYAFTFDENDEEDHSNKTRTVFIGGKQASRKYARTLDPDEFDDTTIAAIEGLMRRRMAELQKIMGTGENKDLISRANYAIRICEDLLNDIRNKRF